ncbi:diguanylate cyclase [Moritella marina]|uniref:sensor domain-containing diguanylate cyclase n=1 Tax=Moritella marina TaxID=90736 RepID=UPI0037042A01
MTQFKARSIKHKLLTPILLFISITFIISQAINYSVTYEKAKQNLIDRVHVLANGVAYNLQAAILFDDALSANEILSAFSADKEVVRVKLYDQDNHEFFATYQVEDEDINTPNKAQLAMIKENNMVISDQYVFLLVPVILEQEQIAMLRITISTASFKLILVSVIKNGIIFLFLLSAAGCMLYFNIQRVIIKPVFALNKSMQVFVDGQKITQQLNASADDEIGDLVNAFSTMLNRLEQREQQILLTMDKLEQEKSFANEVIETVQHALVVTDKAGRIVHFNAAAKVVFQCDNEILKNTVIQQLIYTSDSHLIDSALNEGIDLNDKQFKSQDRCQQEQFLQVSSRKLSKSTKTLFAIQDVTLHEASISKQRLAASVFENSQDGIIVIGHSGVISMANPAVTTLLGFSNEELITRSENEHSMWSEFNELTPVVFKSMEEYGHWQGEVWERHKDGRLIPLQVKINRIINNEKQDVFDTFIILSDISHIKEIERLDHLAHHDELTGLANRTKLYGELNEVATYYHDSLAEFGVIYLDLDGFKLVNDTYGHDAGDEVLKQVAKRLQSQVRESDLVARLSGDEFVLLISPTSKDKITILAERLLTTLKQDIIYKEQTLHIGVSIGIHLVNNGQRDIAAILKHADSAMYQAKLAGKGKALFYKMDMPESKLG